MAAPPVIIVLEFIYSVRMYWRFINVIPSKFAIKEVDIDRAHKEVGIHLYKSWSRAHLVIGDLPVRTFQDLGVEREIDILGRASGHPNIVRFYGSFALVRSKIIGLVMERCDGDLKENMCTSKKANEGRTRSLEEIRENMAHIIRGLDHLHKQDINIVHRCIHEPVQYTLLSHKWAGPDRQSPPESPKSAHSNIHSKTFFAWWNPEKIQFDCRMP